MMILFSVWIFLVTEYDKILFQIFRKSKIGWPPYFIDLLLVKQAA